MAVLLEEGPLAARAAIQRAPSLLQGKAFAAETQKLVEANQFDDLIKLLSSHVGLILSSASPKGAHRLCAALHSHARMCMQRRPPLVAWAGMAPASCIPIAREFSRPTCLMMQQTSCGGPAPEGGLAHDTHPSSSLPPQTPSAAWLCWRTWSRKWCRLAARTRSAQLLRSLRRRSPPRCVALVSGSAAQLFASSGRKLLCPAMVVYVGNLTVLQRCYHLHLVGTFHATRVLDLNSNPAHVRYYSSG